MVANLGSGFASVLSFLWVALVWSNIPWIYSQSMLVSFTSSLTHVTTRHGTMTHLASFAGKLVGASSATKQFDLMMEKSMSYQEALPHFCGAGMDFIFKWCENWVVIAYSSWGMVFAGTMTSVLLFIGAGSTYYYANVHPTATGRTVCNVCYMGAPVIAAAGLILFAFASSEYGKDRSGILSSYKEESLWALGFVIACVFVLATCLPLYTLAVFMRRDPLEHAHKEDTPDEEKKFRDVDDEPHYGAAGLSTQAHPAGSFPQAQSYNPQVSHYATTQPGPAMMQPSMGDPNPSAMPPLGSPNF